MTPQPLISPAADGDQIAAALGWGAVFTAPMDEIAAGRETAARLVGPDIAGEAAFTAVHRRNGAGV